MQNKMFSRQTETAMKINSPIFESDDADGSEVVG
jgi:hypothetical protein